MVDLGVSPLCEDFLKEDEIHAMERFYPLEALVCHNCWLVQVPEYSGNDEIFDEDYGYYSSFSSSWMLHAKRYVDMATERFDLGADSFVVEIASNDGYLLRNFVDKNIPCLGIDPAANVARAAEKVGVKTRVEFFTEELASLLVKDGQAADLVIGNNVMAHTPFLNDFIAGVARMLKPEGTATFECPHLLKLIDEVQFDTIYHEHFSYYSLHSAREIFRNAGLEVVDVQELASAGGSLRFFVEHAARGTKPTPDVARILAEEEAFGLKSIATYTAFAEEVSQTKNELLTLLMKLKQEGKKVVGYGAPGKGNTLLNYCGIKTDLLPFTVDRNVHKHGRFLPGSRIPIYGTEKIEETRPDYVLILPWNLKKEVTAQLAHVKEWGAKFIVPIPVATIVD